MSAPGTVHQAMIRRHFQYKQTITTILADSEADIEVAKAGILDARIAVEAMVAADPFFASTFEPYDPGSDHPIICRMVDAAYEAGVGPMAAVAGTIARAGVEAMQEGGAIFGVVDNGGDIAFMSDRILRIGIYAGNASAFLQSAFLCPPQEKITGVCTSSATVGPSISLGTADAATVFSDDLSAADAWATALCNRLSADDQSEFNRLSGSRVRGAVAIFGDSLFSYGSVPEIVPAKIDTNLITRGI